MDTKTLEYMGERVDKGRDIQKQIKESEKIIDKLTNFGHCSTNLVFNLTYQSGRREGFIIEKKELVCFIKDKTIEATREHIANLEKEFAEL